MTTKKTKKVLSRRKDYNKLVGYCKKRGWSVKIGRYECQSDSIEKTIKLNCSLGEDSLIYTLLHEVGHLINREGRDFINRFPGFKCVSFSRKYRVSYVEQEISAWDKGLSLAGRLGIKVDPNKWYQMKADSLYSYMRWAINPSRYQI